MVKDKIIQALEKATGKKEIHLEIPVEESHGDFSTNIALVANLKAQDIVEKLLEDDSLKSFVAKIEVAGPGFINFWLSEQALTANLSKILQQKDQYGDSGEMKGKKIMVEFAHPNTHKAFHIGHLRNITTGEALSRILQRVGAKVIRANYQGDVGLHIAKALWGIKALGFKDPGNLKGRTDFLAKAYVAGNKAYEEDEKAKEEIGQINEKLYSQKDKELNKIYQTTRKWSLEYFDSIYKRVYTKFDRLYFESEVALPGKKIAQEALKKGILEESQGAIVYKGEKEGLHTRVFVTQKDTPTYEAKDLGLAKLQFAEYSPDNILHVVGPEQSVYFQILFKVLEKLFSQTKGKEVHIVYGWVKLKEGKMSSRKGNVVLGEWLLDETKKRIREKYKNDTQVAEQVAVAAVKYSFLKQNLEQEIAFDFDESINLEGNSGPYLQYTVARTNSVLRKAKRDFKSKIQSEINQEEMALLRSFAQFEGVIIDAANNYSPNLVCNYLFDLAQKYNTFYNKYRIINSANESFRLALTQGTGQILKNGLTLLGIETPEKM